MRGLENKKGISLIVLIITIIVMIILAGAIILALSSNGIIGKANDATEKSNMQTEKERLAYIISNILVKQKEVEIEISDLQNELKDATVSEEGENIIVQFNNSKMKYVVDKSGKITEKKAKGNWKSSGDGKYSIEKNGAIIEVAVGDEFEYSCGDNKTVYTSTKEKNGYEDQVFTASNYTGKWRVFGEEDGFLMLISDVITPDESTHYGLYGVAGYINSSEEFTNIAKIYGQGKNAVSARCVTLNDINNITKYQIEKHNEGMLYAYGNKIEIENTENGIKYYWTKSDGSVSEGNYSSFYYFKDKNFKNLTEIGEKTEIVNNYCSYDISKYITTENQKYIDIILGKGNYWLDYRYERLLVDYAIFGHLIVLDSTKEVDRNYSAFSNNKQYGPANVKEGYYTEAGIRVIIYIEC